MDEAQNLADRVAVIAGGKIVAEGTPDTLGGRDDAASIVRFRGGGGVDDLPVRDGVTMTAGGSVEIRTGTPTRTLHLLTSWAVDRNIELEALTVERPSLEDVYLELAGEDALGE
jgi:ABC-2 type transport system ATP-binding protein